MELELVVAPISAYDEHEVTTTLKRIKMECIQFFESVDTDTYMVFGDGRRQRIAAPLYILEELLPKSTFMRCGWSHILNLSRISGCYLLNDTTIVMDCGEEILVPSFQRTLVLNVMEKQWFAQQRQIG